jgi:hypothetical protein
LSLLTQYFFVRGGRVLVAFGGLNLTFHLLDRAVSLVNLTLKLSDNFSLGNLSVSSQSFVFGLINRVQIFSSTDFSVSFSLLLADFIHELIFLVLEADVLFNQTVKVPFHIPGE